MVLVSRNMSSSSAHFDAFLSHSHDDAPWVESLARRLEDECGFKVWLDRWTLIPGKSWQQAMAKGLQEASSCAVCIGDKTPRGWFQEEIERAVDRQTKDPDFRVIPVLLPLAAADYVPDFLSLRTWADFRNGNDEKYALHVLKQGIKGEPIGRWPLGESVAQFDELQTYEKKIIELRRLHALGLHDEVVIEFERRILTKWFDGDK